jgi:prevent-host-death family protein
MAEMSISAGRTHFSAVIRAAQRGETTVLTRRGRPAAQVAPIEIGLGLYPELAGELGVEREKPRTRRSRNKSR